MRYGDLRFAAQMLKDVCDAIIATDKSWVEATVWRGTCAQLPRMGVRLRLGHRIPFNFMLFSTYIASCDFSSSSITLAWLTFVAAQPCDTRRLTAVLEPLSRQCSLQRRDKLSGHDRAVSIDYRSMMSAYSRRLAHCDIIYRSLSGFCFRRLTATMRLPCV